MYNYTHYLFELIRIVRTSKNLIKKHKSFPFISNATKRNGKRYLRKDASLSRELQKFPPVISDERKCRFINRLLFPKAGIASRWASRLELNSLGTTPRSTERDHGDISRNNKSVAQSPAGGRAGRSCVSALA
jgi:hypothetical protein